MYQSVRKYLKFQMLVRPNYFQCQLTHLHHASADRADGPDADNVVRVASVERRTVRRPLEGRAVRLLGLLANRRELRDEFVNDGLGLEVPDLDAGLGRRAQPVAVRGEAQAVDDVTRIEGVQALPFTEVPKHGDAILTAGGAQGSVRRDGDGVDVASVTNEVGANLAVGEVPDLHELIPTAGHDDRVGGDRGEADAGDPFGVGVGVLDGVLALTERVPQLDRLVTGTGDNLAVVHRESNRKDILGVTHKASGRGTSVKVPQSESAVPRTGEGKLSVRRNHDVLDEVGVTVEGSAGVAVVFFLTGEVPQDHGLVPRRGQEDVGVIQRGRDGGDPVFVPARESQQSYVSHLVRARVSNRRPRRRRERTMKINIIARFARSVRARSFPSPVHRRPRATERRP